MEKNILIIGAGVVAAVAILVLIMFVFTPSVDCVQNGNSCCKDGFCASVSLNCIEGTTPMCGSCNDDCSPNCWCEPDSGTITPLPVQPMANDSQTTPPIMGDVVSANNQFSIDFYSKVGEEEGNVFFSPFSLETALAMTYEGAKGQTATEMQSVLHIPSDDTARRAGFAGLMNDINSGSQDYQLSTANALWAEEDFTFLDDYFQTVENYYLGKVTNLDFTGDSEGSRQIINTWVEDQTNDKIKDLIPSGIIDKDTALVLTNAIYFKGNWATQFKEENTRDADFFVSDSETATVQMMYQSSDFKYMENNDLQLLEMPYEGEELSMVLLLPKSDLDSLDLTSENLEAWRGQTREEEIDVYLPRFKFETKYMLKETLEAMGMPTAFKSGVSDFSGMSPFGMYISQVIHQAFVEVNEEGTEAAAATAVIMQRESVSIPITFRADHPFLFFIVKGDAILFMGRVSNPV